MSTDACHLATGLYAAMRKTATEIDQNKLAVPVTVRTLETLIRLSTAHAKLRLSNSVERKDVEIAFKLLNMTVFQ